MSRYELDRLEMLLQSADYESVTVFRQLAAMLRTRFGARTVDIDSCLRGFDYVGALVALRSMRAEAGDSTQSVSESV